MEGGEVELVHAGVPHPVGRVLLAERCYHPAAEDRPAVLEGDAVPVAPACLDQSVPLLVDAPALPGLDRLAGRTAGAVPVELVAQAFGNELLWPLAHRVLAEDRPVLQLQPGTQVALRPSFLPVLPVVGNPGGGVVEQTVQLCLLPLPPLLGAPLLALGRASCRERVDSCGGAGW